MSLPFLPPLLYSQFLDKFKVLLLILIHYSFGRTHTGRKDLTNSYRSLQNSCAIETGLSDFNEMIVTTLKTYFQKKRTKDNTISRL